VKVEGWREPVHCINVHLGLWARSRRFQLEWLTERIRASVPKKGPLIVAGDFNDWHRRASKYLAPSSGLYEVFERPRAARAQLSPRSFRSSRLEPPLRAGSQRRRRPAPSSAPPGRS
jgi:endonuclease/exonuclease/phosphatase family metal-dependent hydrolase